MLVLDMDTNAMLHCSLFLCCPIDPQILTRNICDIAEIWDIQEIVYGLGSSVELLELIGKLRHAQSDLLGDRQATVLTLRRLQVPSIAVLSHLSS